MAVTESSFSRTGYSDTLETKDIVYDSDRNRVYTLFDRYDGIYKATLVSSDSNNTIDYSIEVPTYRFIQDANLYDGNGQLYTFLENTGDDSAFVLIRWVTSIGSINSFIETNSHNISTSRGNVVSRFNCPKIIFKSRRRVYVL